MGADVSNTLKTAGDMVDEQMTREDVMRQQSQLANNQVQLEQQWQKTIADAQQKPLGTPGSMDDPTLAQQFHNQYVQPSLDSWSKGFSTKEGQEFGQKLALAQNQHFWEKAQSDQAALSAQAHVMQYRNTANMLGVNAYQDPSAKNVYTLLGQVDILNQSAIVGHADTIGAEGIAHLNAAAEEQKAGIVVQAYRKQAETDPDAALHDLADPSNGFNQYLKDPGQIDSLRNYAEQQKKQIAEQQKQAAAAAQKAKEESEVASIYKVSNQFYGPQGQFQANPSAIAQLRTMNPTTMEGVKAQRTALELAHSSFDAQQNGTQVIGDTPTYAAFVARIGDKDNPITSDQLDLALNEANLGRRGISRQQYADLKAAVERQKNDRDGAEHEGQAQIDKWMSDNKAVVDKSTMMGNDAASAYRFGQLRAYVQDQYWANIKAGMTPTQASQDLVNPTSPHYLGNGALQKFQIDTPQGMKALQQEMGKGGKVQLPGGAPGGINYQGGGAPTKGHVPAKPVQLQSDDAKWLAAHRQAAGVH